MPLPFSEPPPSHQLSTAEAGTVRTLMRGVRTSEDEDFPHVVVAHADDTVEEAYRLFKTMDVHHLPIVERETDVLVGVVSSTDLLEYFADCPLADRAEIPLVDVMTKDPETVVPGDSIRDVAKILARATFHCLPVVGLGGEVVGIVTTRDLVRYLDEHFDR